MELAVLTLAMD